MASLRICKRRKYGVLIKKKCDRKPLEKVKNLPMCKWVLRNLKLISRVLIFRIGGFDYTASLRPRTRTTHYVLHLVSQKHLQPVGLLQFCFKNLPSASTHLPSSQTSCLRHSNTLNVSKMTLWKNARPFSALRNCFPFNCVLTERNKNQSQGAKSFRYGGLVTS